MKTKIALKRTTKPLQRLINLRESLGKTQSALAEKYFRVGLTTYQRWERISYDELPGPVQVIIEALEVGGRIIPRK